MAQDDLIIGFQANTSKFQIDVEKAFKTVTQFADKTGDAGRSIEQSFKKLQQTSYNAGGEIQKAFNSLNITSDFTMKLQQDQLQRAKQFFQAQFEAIGRDANSSAADGMRAFEALKGIEAKLNLSTPQGKADAEAKAASAAKIEAEEKYAAEQERIINKLRAASVRAETERILSAEKAAAAEVAAREKAAAAEEVLINRLRADSVRQETQRILAAERVAAAEIAAAEKAAAAKAAAAAEFKAREMASYAAQGMTGEGSAARLIGQGQAGADFARQLKSQMEAAAKPAEETANAINKMQHGMSGFSLASVAAIAKIQILYSLINNIMSTIASIPSTAIDAIESFQASVVKNSAVITSMSGNIKDIGLSYQENKRYAEAVQNVLVEMDAQTIASYKQLQLMNDAFVAQGVFIDINNKKQLDGYRNVANALATISAGMQNPDLQFSQEIRGLMNGEDKPTNMLFRQLQAIDPLLKDHLKQWKQIAAETGNAGYILEKLGPLLVGYAAASGDIDSLWTTVKSTLTTIRDEILRGGLKQGFGEIVAGMKELAKYAEENKEKIQAFIRDGFDGIKTAAESVWNLGKGLSYFAQPAIYGGIALAFAAIAKAIQSMNIAIAATPVGAIAGLVASGAILAGKGYLEGKYSDLDITEIKASVPGDVKGLSSAEIRQRQGLVSGLDRNALAQIKTKYPMMENEGVAELIRNQGIIIERVYNAMNGTWSSIVKFNEAKIKFIQDASQEGVKVPKAPKVAGEEGKDVTEEKFKSYSDLMDRLNKRINENNPYLAKWSDKLKEVDDEIERAVRDNPLYETSIRKAGEAIKQNINLTHQLAEAEKVVARTDLEQSVAEQQGRLVGGWKTDLKWKPGKIKFDLGGAGSMGWGQQPLNVKQAAIEARNLRQEELEDHLMMIDLQEKLSQISGPEALRQRLVVEQELVANQKTYLDTIDKAKDGGAWAKQQMIYMKEQAKAAADLKKAFEETPKGGFMSSLQQYSEAAMNLGAQVKSFTTSVFNQMEDALVSFVTKGKVDFRSLADSIISDMARIAIRQAITGPLASMMGNIFNTNMPTSSVDYNFGSGYKNPSSSMPTFSLAGQKASGGPVLSGKSYLVGERGPEIFTPGVSGGITPNSALGGGGDVYISIENKTGQEVKATQSQTKWDGKKYVKGIVLELIATDSQFRGALGA